MKLQEVAKQKLCIGVIQEFDAAHWLNDYKGKCAKIHGHTWKVECIIKGERLNKQGMIIDFGIVKEKLKEIISTLDHNIVNFVVDQPTAENISKYIYEKMYSWLRFYSVNKTGIQYFLEKITVFETKDNFFELSYSQGYEDHIKDRNKKCSAKNKEYWKKNKTRLLQEKKTPYFSVDERKRRSERMKKNNPMNDRINVEKMMNSLSKSLKIKPNNEEKKLIKILQKENLDYDYVGDLSFIIGGKNPDFINIQRKEIIELFGEFWHSDDNPWYNTRDDEKERKDFFEKRGWKTLIIKTKELENTQSLIEKIAEWRRG